MFANDNNIQSSITIWCLFSNTSNKANIPATHMPFSYQASLIYVMRPTSFQLLFNYMCVMCVFVRVL